MARSSRFQTYYLLHKPGIVYSNAMAAVAGFLLASRGIVDWSALLATLVGTSLVVASGCVYNNYIDRRIDRIMHRTRQRGIAAGIIGRRTALSYATALSILGFSVLMVFTNVLTVFIGLTGLFFYVVVYGIAKRKTVHGTLVGTISGAIPPVAGYAAATNRLDTAALLLFLILVFWQMPHFYAIAMFRRDDYAAAGIPVWPVVKGMRSTKFQILYYTAAFIVAVALLSILGYASATVAVIMVLVGLWWLWRGITGFKISDDIRWGRQMFGVSLVVLLLLCASWSLDSLLP